MHKQRSDIAHRAWNILRLALLWARKGGLFRKRVVMDQLRLFPKFLKTLRHSTKRGAIHYGERELSFENTPIINIKMHRPSSMRFRMPRIPCITPCGDFDYNSEFKDDDDDDDFLSYCSDGGARKTIMMGGDDEDDEDNGCEVCEAIIPVDEEIDIKADQFIAKFYEQMKLQRQISYLQYNEMLNRSTG
ncbi:hypothetical protein RHGRI_035541 [Rhododendron griersonianum]|uniref:DUF761 domain-containing protein n=1 Tax=Rhododendron griersonianum TaxID=479676 RepID=A0AAV6HNM3_9ERIC|nr:hypothetical protein RHGRI_035541 [Rhododendron griersonianum]